MRHQKAGSLPWKARELLGNIGNYWFIPKPSWEVGSSISWVLGDAGMGRKRFT